MTTYSPGDTCPQCNYPIPASQPSLCPNCQYPLLFEESDDNLEATAGEQLRRPTRPPVADQTMMNPRVASEPITVQPSRPAGPTRQCPICGWANPLTRARCERCSATMRAEEPVLPSAPPARPPQKSSKTWILIPVAIVLAALLGSGAYFGIQYLGAGDRGGASPSPGPTTPTGKQSVTLTKIDSKTVEGKASSTLPKDDIDSYGINKTLDGNLKTAWNSHGDQVGAEAEVELTYTFTEPVTIGRIEFYNGFQKNDGVFTRNGRVKSIKIEGGGEQREVTLTDKKGKQSVSVTFGEVESLTMTVHSVYRGSKYSDLAVTEVVFYRAG